MLELGEFIKYISTNYYVEIYDGQVELLPYNNMQLPIISDNDYKLCRCECFYKEID